MPELDSVPDFTFDEAFKAVKAAEPTIDDELAKIAAQNLVDCEILEPDDEDEDAVQLAAGKKWEDLSIEEKAKVADEEYVKIRNRNARKAARKAAKSVANTVAVGMGGINGVSVVPKKPRKPRKPKKPDTGFKKYGFSANCADLVKLAASGKKWERKPDGVLIPDVEIMSLLSKDERPEFKMPGDCDEAWMLRVVDTCQKMAAKGKYPRLLRRHNTPNMPAEVVGKLTNVRWESPWLKADALATEPATIGKLARGEMPSRSAEFYYSTAYLHGLSLTEGEPGHFEEELSDLALADAAGIEELRKLKAGDKLDSIRIAAPLKLADVMPGGMNPKDAEELMRRIANLEAIITANGLTSTPSKPAAKLAAANPELEQLAAEKAALAAQLRNRQDADRLRANGCPWSVDQIVTSLAALSTEEGRSERLKYLATLKTGPSDVLPAEQTKEQRLRLQYRELKKELGERMTQSEDLFVRLNA